MKAAKSFESGSILIYVLMAVALFGMLTFAMTRQMNSGSLGSSIDENRAKLKAEELINYATAARSTIEQMRTMANVLPNEISFLKQGEAGYDTAPHKAKIYHPAGGGLNVFTPTPEMFTDGSATRGWVGQVGTNVEWSKTTDSDVILTFVDVRPEICAAINDRLYKADTVPATTVDSDVAFIGGGGDDGDFATSDCASCNGRNSFCITDTDGANVFYNVIISR